jgi:hypothetical protein
MVIEAASELSESPAGMTDTIMVMIARGAMTKYDFLV